nr:MAG TPA: hypothetical protein [Caudoviricetes sp.]
MISICILMIILISSSFVFFFNSFFVYIMLKIRKLYYLFVRLI